MINAIPTAKGVSGWFAPRDIVTGKRLNLNHLKDPFGEYIEVSVDADVQNTWRGETTHAYPLGLVEIGKVLKYALT